MTASDMPPGFDPRWQSPADFILGITDEIWNDRAVRALRTHYAPDVIVRSPFAVIEGQDAVIAATLATLAEFPDRAVLGEDVIWCATPRAKGQPAGFHSSHRLTSCATHRGDGLYGAATGTALRYRILADCWCAEGTVRDEWVIRDQGAILRQLGHDPHAWTERMIAAEGGPDRCSLPLTPDTEIEGPYLGRGNDAAPGAELAQLLKALMEGAFSVIPARYDRACELAYPGGVTAMGHAAADRFWLGLRAAFPTAVFRVEHASGLEEQGAPPRASIRWTLYGKHDGDGPFGPPSGVYVFVMGITQAEFGPRGLRREWTLYDETAIWKQILLSRG